MTLEQQIKDQMTRLGVKVEVTALEPMTRYDEPVIAINTGYYAGESLLCYLKRLKPGDVECLGILFLMISEYSV